MDDRNRICWGTLPDVCLQNIFTYLQDLDRSSAAVVCKKWNEIMSSALLWKSRTITFSGLPALSGIAEFESSVWYIRKFGRHLEHLQIKFLHCDSCLLTQKFQISMKHLLLKLGRSNNCLKSFSIPHLQLERLIWRNRLRNEFIRSLCLFLKKVGRHLKIFNIRGARTTLGQGCSILHSLSVPRNVTYITKLNIEDFFMHHILAHSNISFHRAMCAFRNLKFLRLNYSCISDTILEILRVNCSHSLSALTIKCHVCDPHMQVVKRTSWKMLANETKDLHVTLSIERIMRYSHLCRILLPEIPADIISIRSYHFREPNCSMKYTITELLPNYKDIIQKLTLEFSNLENIEQQLIQLVLSCKRLYYLKLWAFLSVQFVETILHNQQEGKCALETFKVRLFTDKPETAAEDEMLHEIFVKYIDIIIPKMNYFAIALPLV